MGNNLIPFNSPLITEFEKNIVIESLQGDLSSNGSFSTRAAELLQGVLGVAHVLLTTSCTHALELSLLALGIKPGDEVIVPSFTFVSTANAIVLHGGKPVLVDIDEETLNIDPAGLRSRITPATVGIMVVHYAGNACDMDSLLRIASESNLWIVEDAAHALGARYKGKALGTLGEFGCLSFHSTKNVSCGEGGAILTQKKDLFREAEIGREKGTDRAAFVRREIERYTWIGKGSSYVLAEPLAALLYAQLTRLEQINKDRIITYKSYAEALSGLERQGTIRLQTVPEGNEINGHLFCLRVSDKRERDQLISHLGVRGIAACSHFVPLHTSPFAMKYLGTRKGDFPVTEKVSDTLLRLPLYPGLSEEQIGRITGAVKSFFDRSSSRR